MPDRQRKGRFLNPLMVDFCGMKNAIALQVSLRETTVGQKWPSLFNVNPRGNVSSDCCPDWLRIGP
jgi:hypothetical protein